MNVTSASALLISILTLTFQMIRLTANALVAANGLGALAARWMTLIGSGVIIVLAGNYIEALKIWRNQNEVHR